MTREDKLKLEARIREEMKERCERMISCINKNYIDTEKVDGSLYIKLPLGIEPRFILRDKRIKEIREAISRYIDSRIAIPIEWIEEYNQLVKELKEGYPKGESMSLK